MNVLTTQTATFHPTSGPIYYLGDHYMTSEDGYKKRALKSYNYTPTFNNGDWSNITLYGRG